MWIRIRIDLALVVPDPDWAGRTGSGTQWFFLPLDSGWKKSGFGINISDHIYDSLVRIFWFKNIEFFVANPDLVSGIEKSGFEIKKSRNRNKSTYIGVYIYYFMTCCRYGYKFTFFWRKSLTRFRIRIGLARWIRIRIKVKSWIRTRIEANADPPHWL